MQRIKRGVSMNRVAKMAGLSQQMVSYVERGMRHPTRDTLLRIAGALEIELWKLLEKATGTKKVSSG
ncbi:MAG: helix-turn-helix transcriptional regulator [Anaerolineaceae bacterium]